MQKLRSQAPKTHSKAKEWSSEKNRTSPEVQFKEFSLTKQKTRHRTDF